MAPPASTFSSAARAPATGARAIARPSAIAPIGSVSIGFLRFFRMSLDHDGTADADFLPEFGCCAATTPASMAVTLLPPPQVRHRGAFIDGEASRSTHRRENDDTGFSICRRTPRDGRAAGGGAGAGRR